MALPDPTLPFDFLTSLTHVSSTRATANLPEQWRQGRGLFGGIVAATLTRALGALAPDRPLRSLAMEIPAPVEPGETELELEVLREGNAVTTASVRLRQQGELRAHAVGVLGQDRIADRDSVDLPPPTPHPWREVEVVPVQAPLGPEFSHFFEYRPTGPLPLSGEQPIVEGWVRPKHPGSLRDAPFLAACVDAYWPAHLTRESLFRPMATVAFTVQPRPHFEGLDPEAPFFHRARVLATDGGYSVELRELWGEDGRLLALNQQTFAIIK